MANLSEKFFTGSVATISGISILSDIIESKMFIEDTDIKPPIDTVSIIVPSYNEEQFIETCLSSIINQSIFQQFPEYFEIILVDSNSTDNTVNLAKTFLRLHNDGLYNNISKDRIIIAPRGKLISRNMATDIAKGNIIVSTDADTYYTYHWLNTLLKPFSSFKGFKVAGSVGGTLDYSITNIPGKIHNIVEILNRKILNPNQMIGRNSAYWKHLFYLSGRFDTTINQFNIKEILGEEEIGFGNRLSKFGEIIYQLNALCIHLGGQKVACRLNVVEKKLCDYYGIGKERF